MFTIYFYFCCLFVVLSGLWLHLWAVWRWEWYHLPIPVADCRCLQRFVSFYMNWDGFYSCHYQMLWLDLYFVSIVKKLSSHVNVDIALSLETHGHSCSLIMSLLPKFFSHSHEYSFPYSDWLFHMEEVLTKFLLNKKKWLRIFIT